MWFPGSGWFAAGAWLCCRAGGAVATPVVAEGAGQGALGLFEDVGDVEQANALEWMLEA